MADPAGRKPPDEARARVQALAREAVVAGGPTAWFDVLYRETAGDASKVPWADLAPNAALSAWTRSPRALSGARTAVVVGCGLGHDAELLAAKGLVVTAFDVSPAAIAWAKRLHPGSKVRYETADLFALPPAWRGAFDLVVEIYTLQALPGSVRGDAARAVESLLARDGRMFLYARLRDDGPTGPPFDEKTMGPPWPLGRHELPRRFPGLVPEAPMVEAVDAEDPSIVRAHGVWRKSAT